MPDENSSEIRGVSIKELREPLQQKSKQLPNPSSHRGKGRSSRGSKRVTGRSVPQRRRRNSSVFTAAIIILLIMLWTSGAIWYIYPGMLWTQAEPKGLIINGETYDDDAFAEVGGKLFVRYDIANSAFGATLFYENTSERVILTTSDQIIEMRTDLLTTYVNYEEITMDVPVQMIENQPYISVDFLAPIYDLSIEKYDTGIYEVSDGSKSMLVGEDIKRGFIREMADFRSARVAPVLEGEKLYIYEEANGWYSVRNTDGLTGFIRKNKIKISEVIDAVEKDFTFNPPWYPVGDQINLTWDPMTKPVNDMKNYKVMPGVNVISPTWFSLEDTQGTVKSVGSLAYTDWAHENGLQVWALFDNSFNPEITSEVIRDFDRRRHVISQILVLAEVLDIDGVNIDFENIYLVDSEYLTQFVRELSVMLHEQDLTVSMDVTVVGGSDNWSKVFDRPALIKAVDYMAVMTYDEHWAASPIAGSVASIPWVRTSLERILEQVPREQLLMGIPFYTRIWEEIPQTDGSVDVSSKAYSMQAVIDILADKGAQITFDEETGQDYASYIENGNTYKVWIENEQSIRQRVRISREFRVAGIASWRRGFELESIWDAIGEELARNP